MKAFTLARIFAKGTWASTHQQTAQWLDIPGRRRAHRAVAPDWVMEITEDALRRAKGTA